MTVTKSNPSGYKMMAARKPMGKSHTNPRGTSRARGCASVKTPAISGMPGANRNELAFIGIDVKRELVVEPHGVALRNEKLEGSARGGKSAKRAFDCLADSENLALAREPSRRCIVASREL